MFGCLKLFSISTSASRFNLVIPFYFLGLNFLIATSFPNQTPIKTSPNAPSCTFLPNCRSLYSILKGAIFVWLWYLLVLISFLTFFLTSIFFLFSAFFIFSFLSLCLSSKNLFESELEFDFGDTKMI